MKTLTRAIYYFFSCIINTMYIKVFSFNTTSNNGVLYCGGDACGCGEDKDEEDCDCGEEDCDCE